MSNDRVTQVPLGYGSQLEFPVQYQPASENAWNSIAFIWRRKFLILFLVCVGLSLGYLYYVKKTPEYESQAQILVVSASRPSLTTDSDGLPIETAYDRTRIELLMSPVVLERAVEAEKLSELPSFRGVDHPVSEIISNLDVTGNVTDARPGRTSDVLTVTYRSAYAEDCPKVLEAVHQAFAGFMADTYESINKETFELISEARDQLDGELSDLEQKYNAFRAESALLRQGEVAHNLHEERLAQIEAVRSAARVENSTLLARYQAIERALQAENRLDALRMLIDDIEGPSSQRLQHAVDTESKLLPMMVEEQRLLENYGEAHPKVIAIRKEIELTREYMQGLADSQSFDAQNPLSVFNAYLQSLKERIEINTATMAEMDTLFEEEREKAKSMVDEQRQEENFRAQIARKQRMFDAVVKRLEEISFVKDSGKVTTKLIYPPTIGAQVAPNALITFSFAGTAGLLLGLGLAYVLEVSDRRFKSPDEIHHTLGIPVMGHIPEIMLDSKSKKAAKRNPAAVDPTLQTVHAPKSRIAEAYRGVRTSLYFGTRGRGSQVILVTSPNPGDGKTTFSANLATCIAQSGKRVLLIDADFRRPRLHQLFKIRLETGLSQVMSNDVEIEDAVQLGPVDNLYVLSCGPRPENPSELLTSQKFDELLQVVREKYDFVIIDAPPILAVSDPLALASRVDGTLLVIRLSKHARHQAARAMAELASVNAVVQGVVVNAIGGPGFGYGNYRSGFGSDGNGYLYNGYGSYHDYADDEEYASTGPVAHRNGKS